MTLAEMKEKVFTLIEEYNEDEDNLTEDEDLGLKMNGVVNQIQNEIARHKKIPAYKIINVKKGQVMQMSDIDSNIYQINTMKGVEFDMPSYSDTIEFLEDGEIKIHYFKYPTQIDSSTSDDFVFELTRDVLEIMPYGVAGDLLKSDVASNFGTIYSARYREMLSELDPRNAMGSVFIDGGII